MNERMLAAAVDAWAAMHRDELVRDLISLINIPSVTGTPGCDAAADHLAELAKKYGFAVERDGSYSVSVLHAGAKESRELGMLGHIDVVPEGDGWKFAPYAAVEKDSWVIGRGSSDCKGPVVMCLYVLRCLREMGIALENVNWSPPRLDSLDEPEVQILLDTCREFLDPNAKPYVMGGGTHSRVFPRSLPYGPGVMDPRRKKPFGEAHGADEAVCVDDLIRAIHVYVLALKRLDEYFEKEEQS